MKKKAVVLGLGSSGIWAAYLLLDKGYEVFAADDDLKALNSEDAKKLSSSSAKLIHAKEPFLKEEIALFVLSPGIHPKHPWVQAASSKGVEVIGEAELALREVKSKVIGITGTNGKTTVTLLVAHVLQSAGIEARALGNVGDPLSLALRQGFKGVWVVELSSFQLETLSCQVLDAAALLNITPDHLDRYASMDEYAQAKWKIASNCLNGAKLFVYSETNREFGHLQPPGHQAKILSYGFSERDALYTDQIQLKVQEKVEYILPVGYRGVVSHDVENIMAAYALCKELGVSAKAFDDALSTFKKPAHRVEFVLEREGVRFFDDSKGTNIDAVIKAVSTMREKRVVLIAGGVDKGFPYTSWVKHFKGKVAHVYAIGQSAHKIEQDLNEHIPVTICPDLESAVQSAAVYAQEGDAVLLSPGCSSYDMFRNYAHRGDEFKRIVSEMGSLEERVRRVK